MKPLGYLREIFECNLVISLSFPNAFEIVRVENLLLSLSKGSDRNPFSSFLYQWV